MNEAIQDLINLAKVDNSKATTDKMAKALGVAAETFDDISLMFEGGPRRLVELAYEKIQVIAEGECDVD